MATSKMPILPLTSVSQLLTTLQSFQRQLCVVPSSRKVDAQYELLPFSNVGDAMTEHTRNILSDICHSIPELAGIATTSDGQEQLRDWLSEPNPNSAQNIIDFVRISLVSSRVVNWFWLALPMQWKREYLLEWRTHESYLLPSTRKVGEEEMNNWRASEGNRLVT